MRLAIFCCFLSVRARNHSLVDRVIKVGTGYCSPTVFGWAGDCTAGELGTWAIPPKRAVSWCVQQCLACPRCRFVSVSLHLRDCSWFNECATGSLGFVYGGRKYTTYDVRPRTSTCHSSRRERVGTRVASDAGAGVHMVTFYSEGQPQDPGIPLAAMAGVFEAAFAPHVDSFNAYTPRSVAPRVLRGIPGTRVVQASRVGASMNTGLSAIGQLAVKPYIILLRMLEIPPGDLLVYKDANILKRPQLLAGASRIRAMAAWALSFAAPAHDVFIPFENTRLKLKHHCKSHAVRTMVPPAEWDAVFESPLHHSCQVIARRTPAAEAFLWAWLQACLRKDMLEQEPDPVMTRHPEFRWHTHEQCLFSIVANLQQNVYARQLWFCWKLTEERLVCTGSVVHPTRHAADHRVLP
ncbi:hypothetical protein AB1Y20_015058 [Prymnesium parvum]|uniref:Uncharacterized protein n=1 Tax=Prymnesium parvum TaxID=97485 RepID=A0AB34K1F8_PRYPA